MAFPQHWPIKSKIYIKMYLLLMLFMFPSFFTFTLLILNYNIKIFINIFCNFTSLYENVSKSLAAHPNSVNQHQFDITRQATDSTLNISFNRTLKWTWFDPNQYFIAGWTNHSKSRIFSIDIFKLVNPNNFTQFGYFYKIFAFSWEKLIEQKLTSVHFTWIFAT